MVHNAAVARLNHGRAVLVLRSHLATGRSILGYAESTDCEQFTVWPKPVLIPASEAPLATYERFGVAFREAPGGPYLVRQSGKDDLDRGIVSEIDDVAPAGAETDADVAEHITRRVAPVAA